jgi:hypothetical protein
MTFVADSSFLLRLYLRDAHTSAIEHFLTEDTKVVSLSELARIEVLNTLLRYEGRSEQFIADLKERGRLQLEWLPGSGRGRRGPHNGRYMVFVVRQELAPASFSRGCRLARLACAR